MHRRRTLFWQTFFVTLLLVVPMMAGVVYFAARRAQQQTLVQAAADQSGVTQPAGARQTFRLLLAVQGDPPAFLLVRCDGVEQSLVFCALPGEMVLDAPAGQTTLAECYLTAGPARAAELLTATLGVAPDAYLAATAATLADVWGEEGVRFDTAAVLDVSHRKALGLEGDTVAELTADQAADFLGRVAALPDLDPPALAQVRGALWASFVRQNPGTLAGITDALRGESSRLLTDLRAQDWQRLGDCLSWLSGASGLTVDYCTPSMDAAARGWQPDAEGTELLLTLLEGGSPVTREE